VSDTLVRHHEVVLISAIWAKKEDITPDITPELIPYYSMYEGRAGGQSVVRAD
jgi:hypothetical protein